MCFYGHGDHGGGPTEEMVKKIEDMKNEVQEFVVDFSTPDEFFQALESHLPEFPVVVDDLQHHSRGCYTVVSDIKRANRMLESSLVSAEKFCSMASLHLGVPYPREILRRSWETLLFHQFHDIMGGTSIKPAYDDASKAMRMAKDLADSEAEFAMEALSARIDTAGDGRSILVFNPSPCPREDPIRFEAILPGDENLVAFDESGTRHPLQVDSSVDFKDEKMVSASFIAGLPPIGYRVFWIREGQGNGTDVTGAGNTVENSLIRISVDPDTGYLCSVFDKTTGTEYLKGPSRPILIRDDSDTWSHDVVVFGDEIGTFQIEGEPSVEIGPVEGSISVSSTYGNSRLVQKFSIRTGSPLVECTLDLDWHERHTIFKLSFPVDVLDPRAIYEIPYGTIERPTSGQEEPGQRWLDVVGKDGEGKEKGLLMVNDSKYGFSVDGSEMRISIVRSPIFAFHRPRKPESGKTYVYTDQGKHRIGLVLYPHRGAVSEEKFQLAERFNNPPIVAFSNSHSGSLPPASSLISCAPGNVILGAVKVAEEHEGIILRLFESAGRQTRCNVALPLLGIEFSTDIGPWEIKTLAVSSAGTARETDLLE